MGNTGVEGNLNGNGKETGNQDNLIGQAEKGVEKIGHQQEGGNKLPAENSQRQKEKTRFFPPPPDEPYYQGRQDTREGGGKGEMGHVGTGYGREI